MKFFDREEELKEALELDKPGSRMLVIYGRRRIGKTALIKKFFESSNAKKLYFFVPKNEKMSVALNDFAEITKEVLGLKDYEKISSFSDLVKLLFDRSRKEKIIVAFDEFQNFKYIYPDAIDILQKEWDMQHDGSNLSVVISGSTIGMIKKIFTEQGSPLFKRAYNMIELDELSVEKTFKLMSELGIKKFEDRLMVYFLFGGVLYYYALIDYYNLHAFDEIIGRLLISPVAPLKDVVKSDIIEAFGSGSATYFAILEAIANGKNTNNEAAAYAQIKETSLPAYIYDMENMLGVIETVTIPTQKPKPGSKRNALAIADNFYEFWFNAISRNYSCYEINDMERLKQQVYAYLPIFAGKEFEKFVYRFLEYLSKNRVIFHIDKIGRWWGKDPGKPKGMNEEEIDVVALNEKS
ncbi:MAG: ATP-binding protein, partial [Candidatus Micrarchaeia archaeon]